MDLAPSAMKRLVRELQDLQEKPLDGIRVLVNEQNLGEVQAEIDGPVGTPYENGVFKMRLCIGSSWPAAPPSGFFISRIFHPNVSNSGEICVNVLKRDWKPECTLGHVLAVVRCLLIDPNPESALNEEAGRLLLESYDDFARQAKLMTSIHAQPKKPAPLSESTAHMDSNRQPQPQQQAGADGSPPKKPKADVVTGAAVKASSAATAKVKKALKRL